MSVARPGDAENADAQLAVSVNVKAVSSTGREVVLVGAPFKVLI